MPLQVSFGAATYSINENDGSGVASISVQLNQVAGTTVTVVCQVNGATPGSATNTFDYAFISTVVTFTPGQTSQTCDVPLIDDIVYEGDETVNLELVSPTGGASLGTPQNTVLTIVDDEAIPTVQFLTTAYSINESDPGVIDIPVVLSGPTQANATVDFSIGGTAPGSDYTLSPSGPPITFSGGLTVQTLSFNTNDNGAVDGTRTVTITLSSPSANLTLGGSTQTTISIIDDDSAPTCVGAAPGAGEPQVLTTPPGGSPPFGTSTDIACGQSLVVNLGGLALLADGNSDYDLVFYESYTGTGIQLDWVVVQVGTSAAGPWYTVFYWGDQIADTNTNVSSGVEADNAVIPQASLYNLAGILIDIDFAAPPGVYQYVRIFSPNNTGADASQVDALQVCQASPCP